MIDRKRGSEGFTLVELLVVMIIMPLVIGATAAAIIVAERNSGTTQSRLVDSTSAQINSEYYASDVQGAQFVTTNGAVTSPVPVCVNPNLTSPTLVLGLYRPATSTVDTTPPQQLSNGLSVGYWLTSDSPPQLVRDACTVTTSGGPTYYSEVPISDDVTPSGVTTAISPSQFGSAASSVWTPTSSPSTTVTSATLLTGPSFSLHVASSLGFATGGSVSLFFNGAFVPPLTCLPSTPTALTCSGGDGLTTAPAGAIVTQQVSISAINLSVTEPGSSYIYSLHASPRAWSTAQIGPAPSGSPYAAALVSLTNLSVSGSASITVNGNANIGGATNVSGGAGARITAYGNVNTNGATTCGVGIKVLSGGPNGTNLCNGSATTPVPVGDPLANYIPTPFPTLTNRGCRSDVNGATNGSFTLQPGTYSCPPGVALNVQRSVIVTLSPGVYQFQGGINVQGNGQLLVGSGGGGALLYVSSGPVTFSNGVTVNIPPLTSAQSTAVFGTTALQGVWLWQDASDSQGASLIGNEEGVSGNPPTGTAYLPGAAVTISNSAAITTGRIIAKSVTGSGNSPITLTGQ